MLSPLDNLQQQISFPASETEDEAFTDIIADELS
jgi:hypothetical protein